MDANPLQQNKKVYAGFLFLSLALFLILSIAYLMPIQPNDYWWYVRIGKDIVQQGGIPQTETLSYSASGQPVVYQTWLAALVFWGVHTLGGLGLTNLLRGSLLGIFYLFIWLSLRQAGAGPKLAGLLAVLAALVGSNNWAMRPQLFAYPLFGVSLWALVRWQKGHSRSLWLLPPLAALWVNLHGSYLLLFILAGAALLVGKGDRRRLLVAGGLALLATFLNPLGPLEWAHTFDLVNDPTITQFSAEWQPPVNLGWQMNLFYAWLLVFPLLVALSPQKPAILEWFWFLGFGWMALSGLRYIVWFSASLALLSAGLLAAWIGKRFDRPGRFGLAKLNLAIGIFLLVLPLALLPGVRDAWWPDAPPALGENTPVEATVWLAGRPELPGPLWSELAFSSYLTYALPERPVWIHTRFESFPPEQFRRYIDISEALHDWQAQLDEEGVNLLLLSLKEQPHLVQAVEGSPLWKEVYRDQTAVIFTRLEALQQEADGSIK